MAGNKVESIVEDGLFCQVVFPLVVGHAYTYLVPHELQGRVLPGMRVLVPFGKKREVGYVVEVIDREPSLGEGVELKPILKTIDADPVITSTVLRLVRLASDYYLEPMGLFIRGALPPSLRGDSKPSQVKRVVVLCTPLPDVELTKRQRELVDLLEREGPLTMRELSTLGGFSRSVVKRLMQRGVVREEDRVRGRLEPSLSPVPPRVEEICLTGDQRMAIDTIVDSIGHGYRTFLLHGITGSGKTEVYLRLCAKVLKGGGSALVLVPEISLTPHYISRFRGRFGDAVALLHSGLGVSDRWRAWERVRRGECRVVVGTRSAVFAPVPKLGLVVVDEEHDASYKQETRPRYNARDLAVLRGMIENATVVLGSATPSLESYHNALSGRYSMVELSERVGKASLPRVEVVDMREHKGPISLPLQSAMREAISRGEKVLLLLNRRGYSPLLMCSLCGWVPTCPNCDISLTYHKSPPLMVCHYCGQSEHPLDLCTQCGGEMRVWGRGTQRLSEEVEGLFPGIRVARMDRDTTSGRDGVWRVLSRLERGDVDVLVGTQMVAKGHHYPSITVGGVLMADLGLRIPDFRAAERTFQLLTQLAGRTGRGERDGVVVIQTFMPGHYSIKWAKRQDFKGFADEELAMRQAFGYPPFVHLSRVIFSGSSEEKVEMVANKVAGLLSGQDNLQVLGPAPAPLARLRNRVRWHLLIKSGSRGNVTEMLKKVPLRMKGVSVEIDRDPYSLM